MKKTIKNILIIAILQVIIYLLNGIVLFLLNDNIYLTGLVTVLSCVCVLIPTIICAVFFSVNTGYWCLSGIFMYVIFNIYTISGTYMWVYVGSWNRPGNGVPFNGSRTAVEILAASFFIMITEILVSLIVQLIKKQVKKGAD